MILHVFNYQTVISYLLYFYEEPKEAGLISYLVEEMLTVANQTHVSEDLIKLIVWVSLNIPFLYFISFDLCYSLLHGSIL